MAKGRKPNTAKQIVAVTEKQIPKGIQYKINDNTFITVESEVLRIWQLNITKDECVIELSEMDANVAIDLIKSFLPCKHEWVTVRDYDNGNFFRTPIKDICKKCGIDKPIEAFLITSE